MPTEIRTFNFKKGLPFEFEIKDLDSVSKAPHLFAGPFKATFYQFIWLTKGDAVMHIDFRDIHIRAGEGMMISVNQIYEFDVESDYEGKLLLFTDTFFNRAETDGICLYTSDILNPIRLNQIIRFPDLFMDNLMQLFDNELKQQNQNIFRPDIVRHLLSVLLLQAERWIAGNAHNLREMSLGRTFFNAVETHFKKGKHVEFYVKNLNVYEKTLSKEVKSMTSKTPKQYIDARIVLEAKRLLAYSTMSVKEICFELGWDEATNFNKFFKKHTQITPLEFRDSLR